VLKVPFNRNQSISHSSFYATLGFYLHCFHRVRYFRVFCFYESLTVVVKETRDN